MEDGQVLALALNMAYPDTSSPRVKGKG